MSYSTIARACLKSSPPQHLVLMRPEDRNGLCRKSLGIHLLGFKVKIQTNFEKGFKIPRKSFLEI